MFSCYQIHPTRINKTNGAPSSKDRVTADVKSNTKYWSPQFTSSFLSGIKTIQKVQPKTPPNGFISLCLVLLMAIEILTILNGIKCHHILNSRNSTLSLASKGATATGILTTSKGVADCISLSSKGDNDFGVSKHTLHSMEDFKQDINTLFACFKDSLLHLLMRIQKSSTCNFTLTQTQYVLIVTTQSLVTFAMTLQIHP
jgi:hypothetical protein